MTGTPVANRPYDLWSQIYFLDQGSTLGTDFTAFKQSLDLGNCLFDDITRRGEFELALSSVYSRIQPFSVRETKESSGVQLPEKRIINHFVPLEHRQADIYNSYKHELGSILIRHGLPEYDNADDILKRLLRLVQVASNPAILDNSYKRDPGKIAITEELIGLACDSTEKVILWTSFIENANWLAKRFEHFGSVTIHGKLDYAARERNLKSFSVDPETRVLVATPGAAKEGLTLTSANHAIFFDRSFSLDDYLQAQDRIHRISQTKACFVHNIIAISTIDEWVDRLLIAKQVAAQLAQGDTSFEEYKQAMNYDFPQILQCVLATNTPSSNK